MFSSKAVPEGVIRELDQLNHDPLILNGEGEEVGEIIAQFPFKDAKDLRSKFSLDRKIVYAQGYDKIEDEFIQKLLLHVHPKVTFKYIDAKDDEKKVILNEVTKKLLMFDEARIAQTRIEKKLEVAEEFITTNQEMLDKLNEEDNVLVRETGQKMRSLQKEMGISHPSEEKIDQLMQAIKDNINKIIGEEKIAKARSNGAITIAMVQKRMEEDETPEDVKPHFLKRIAFLTKVMEGTNVPLINETIEDMGKELEEKTSKELRANTWAIDSITRMMVRITLSHMFKATNKKFDAMIVDIVREKISPAYASYTNSLGRFGRKQDTLETFTNVEYAALNTVVNEIIFVSQGNDDIESIELTINASISSDRVDAELDRLQAIIFGLQKSDLSDPNKRLIANRTFLEAVKTEQINYFIDESGFTEYDAKVLVEGPLYIHALEMIPDVLSKKFNALEKIKEEKAKSTTETEVVTIDA